MFRPHEHISNVPAGQEKQNPHCAALSAYISLPYPFSMSLAHQRKSDKGSLSRAVILYIRTRVPVSHPSLTLDLSVPSPLPIPLSLPLSRFVFSLSLSLSLSPCLCACGNTAFSSACAPVTELRSSCSPWCRNRESGTHLDPSKNPRVHYGIFLNYAWVNADRSSCLQTSLPSQDGREDRLYGFG